MIAVEAIAHVDLRCKTSITPYLRIVSFFVKKLSLLQKSHKVSYQIKKYMVQEAFTLFFTNSVEAVSII